ncbi:MAG: NUMOD4 motif-containing HNH endonuclease [Anaerolineaceae bacterium]|nr:NUMOD4 motif-containing HNH endonuclease [Anaerolineaceae bacterium]
MKTQERWRVLSSNKNYLVSDHGRVMRITRGKGTEPGRVLKPGKTKDGYLKVELFNNGRPCSRYIHRLVVEAFIGEIPAGLEVNHISGQKVDNCIENLEVVTHAKNTQHAWDTGLRSRATFKLAA